MAHPLWLLLLPLHVFLTTTLATLFVKWVSHLMDEDVPNYVIFPTWMTFFLCFWFPGLVLGVALIIEKALAQ